MLGNDERVFTGLGVHSMGRVTREVGQGAAVPHRGLSYIQDLITHCLLGGGGGGGGVGEVVRERENSGPTESPGRGRGEEVRS